MRLYPSVDQVLGFFDIAGCSVGWSPETGLVMTNLCGISLATGLLFVDTGRRSKTYESRLIKYGGRGFKVVFAGLAILCCDLRFQFSFEGIKLPERDPGEVFNYHNAKSIQFGEWLTVHETYNGWRMPYDEKPPNENNTSDYGEGPHPSIIAYSNIIKAVNGGENLDSANVILVADSLPNLLTKPSVPGMMKLDELYKNRVSMSHAKCHIPVIQLYKVKFFFVVRFTFLSLFISS